MTERSERLERILEHRRSEEERCQERVRELRAIVRARERRLEELGAELGTCQAHGYCHGHAGSLLSSERCAGRLRVRSDELRERLQRDRDRLEAAQAELAAAGQRRLAVERLLKTRVTEARRQEVAGLQRDLDDHGRLRVMLEEG